ncbi:MAG: VTT domain-containing protein [Myxococcota bacterium]
MRRALPFVLAVVLLVAFAAGGAARTRLAFDFSPESIQAYVRGLGMMGPLIYLALLTFRHFLLLPSVIVLTAGGLVFGAALGTLLGGAGITLTALMGYALARGIGGDWVRKRFGARYQRYEKRGKTASLMLAGLVTAHPIGPMTPFHWAAGFSSVAWLPFLLAVAVAAFVRAFSYALFGAALLEPGSQAFYVSTLLLVGLALLPLAHPAFRRRAFGRD